MVQVEIRRAQTSVCTSTLEKSNEESYYEDHHGNHTPTCHSLTATLGEAGKTVDRKVRHLL